MLWVDQPHKQLEWCRCHLSIVCVLSNTSIHLLGKCCATANIRRLHFGVPFLEPSGLKQAHWIALEVCESHQEISITNWFIRGSALGPIGGLSARQFNGCLPRREEKN